MACVHNKGLRRTELQIEPILPEGYGVLKALRALVEVLWDAYDLHYELRKRYPKCLW
jgi:hypothetical protein